MFKKNQLVYITRLRAHGTVTEVKKEGGYRVAVGSLTFEFTSADLQFVEAGTELRPSIALRKKRRERGTKVNTASLVDRLDLHGFHVEEAIAAVQQKVDRALLEDRIARLEIIHGVGTGKLKTAIHVYLRNLGLVTFKSDIANPGVTWVYFE